MQNLDDIMGRYYELNGELNELQTELDNIVLTVNDRKSKYIDKLNKIKAEEDTEECHIKADELLCDLLDELGYSEITEIFNGLDKEYSYQHIC